VVFRVVVVFRAVVLFFAGAFLTVVFFAVVLVAGAFFTVTFAVAFFAVAFLVVAVFRAVVVVFFAVVALFAAVASRAAVLALRTAAADRFAAGVVFFAAADLRVVPPVAAFFAVVPVVAFFAVAFVVLCAATGAFFAVAVRVLVVAGIRRAVARFSVAFCGGDFFAAARFAGAVVAVTFFAGALRAPALAAGDFVAPPFFDSDRSAGTVFANDVPAGARPAVARAARVPAGMLRVAEPVVLLLAAVRFVAGRVAALPASAIWVPPRGTSPPVGLGRSTTGSLDAGLCRAGLALLPGPAGVLGLPCLVALLHLLQRTGGVGGGGIRAEEVLGGTRVVAVLDPVVAHTPVEARTTSAVAHGITVPGNPTSRHRFRQTTRALPQ
jgi:hypothetical protein